MRANIDLLGWVTLEPKIEFTPHQKRVMKLGVNAGGKPGEPNFHNVIIFERSIDYVEKLNLKKGDVVLVSGTQRNKKYTDKKTDQTKTWSEVLMSDIVRPKLEDDTASLPVTATIPEDEGGAYDDVPF